MLNVTIAGKTPDVRILLEGDLDMFTGEALDKVVERIDPALVTSVTFSLSGLHFIDSTGIGQLIRYYRTFGQKDVPVYLDNDNQDIEEVIQLIGLRELMG